MTILSLTFIVFIVIYSLISQLVIAVNDHNVDDYQRDNYSMLRRGEKVIDINDNDIDYLVKKLTLQQQQSKRKKRQALLSSGSTHIEGSGDLSKVYRRILDRYNAAVEDEENGGQPSQECRKRRLRMCQNQVPFNSTIFPNIIGDQSDSDVNQSLPFFYLLAKSQCNKRLKQLLCTFLEPPCHKGRPIPPCKKFCRVALEGCAEYIPATLELSSVFDCRQYPDSTDQSICVNLAMGSACANDEFHCPDKSCIPKEWLCDGVRDCIFAADEANCQNGQTTVCSSEEFTCDGKCIPMTWRCDGDRDCQDGSDEVNCSTRPQCGPDRFKCADGFGCIPRRWVCDGKQECRDGSDEVGCSQRECSRGDFKCQNGICIPRVWLCDGTDDCKDNSDEKNCVGGTMKPSTPSASSSQPVSNNLIQQQSIYHSQQTQPSFVNHNNIGPFNGYDNNLYRWAK